MPNVATTLEREAVLVKCFVRNGTCQITYGIGQLGQTGTISWSHFTGSREWYIVSIVAPVHRTHLCTNGKLTYVPIDTYIPNAWS